jgi:hypothetical protein
MRKPIRRQGRAIRIVSLQIEVRRSGRGKPSVRHFLRDAGTGSVTIVFTDNHEIVVEGTIADVMDNLQGRK